jgi:hypothetical protein
MGGITTAIVNYNAVGLEGAFVEAVSFLAFYLAEVVVAELPDKCRETFVSGHFWQN